MGEVELGICWMSKKAMELKEELLTIGFARIMGGIAAYYEVEFEVLRQKGLKYLPMIIATACDSRFAKEEKIKDIFEELRKKVKIRIRKRCQKTEKNMDYSRVFWPCEILDLKEVQDEVKMLNGFLLSKENPDDVEMMRRIAGHPFDESTIRWLNMCVGDLKAMLTRATEFHRKHPDVKFWFRTVFV